MRHILLAALALGMAAAFYLSPRGYMLTNMPRVALVEELPPQADAEKLGRFLDYSAILLPKSERDAETVRLRPALGFSYREVSILRVPLFAYADQGYVLFVEGPKQVQMVPLDADYMKLLEAEAGQPLAAGYTFPWWRHIWGWSFLIGFIAWWILQVRAERRREFEPEPAE
jgi:hypothetical protein